MRELSIGECSQVSGGIEEIVVYGSYNFGIGGCIISDPYLIQQYLYYLDQQAYYQQLAYYAQGGGGSSTPTAANNIGYDIDGSFISQNEGGQQTSAYTLNPTDHPSAGATVATGVDLGQVTEGQLRGWGISETEINQLRPYLGLQGQTARDYENNNPLVISQSLASQLDQGIMRNIMDPLIADFNASNATVDFAQLPQGVQTAIADLAYQYGPNLEERTPYLWNCITDNQWQSAVDELNDFGDNYDTRRQAEAALIEAALAAAGSQ